MTQLWWSLVAVVNVAAFAVFGWDKWRAGRPGARRVRERTLLWFVFWTGWVGAWLAIAWFRHKTRKQPFRAWAMLWTVVNPFWVLVWWTLAATT